MEAGAKSVVPGCLQMQAPTYSTESSLNNKDIYVIKQEGQRKGDSQIGAGVQ